MTSLYPKARHLPAGDHALSVELGDSISPEINRRIRGLLFAIEKRGIQGVADLVPAYRSILVYYDPSVLSLPDLEAHLRELEEESVDSPVEKPKVIELPTVYGGEYGPDLDEVATHNGLTSDGVIEIHSNADYLVYMMGFTPAFPYLGGMSEKIATPRLSTPRASIPAGSVGIAEGQTGVYPVESPGGWRLIGRTPVRFFDPRRDPPAAVDSGDFVRFVPVTEDEYLELLHEVQAGNYKISSRTMD